MMGSATTTPYPNTTNVAIPHSSKGLNGGIVYGTAGV